MLHSYNKQRSETFSVASPGIVRDSNFYFQSVWPVCFASASLLMHKSPLLHAYEHSSVL